MDLLESPHLSSNIYRCIPNKKLLQLRDECFIVQYQYFGLLIQRYGWLVLASLCGCHARVSDGSSDHVFVADLASRPMKHTYTFMANASKQAAWWFLLFSCSS